VSEDSLIGTVISERYRVDALIGEGAMGRVYRGEHVLMKKRVAIKLMHRELSSVPEIVQRFEREAHAAAHIDHPHVASCTDFGTLPDGTVFLVLEYVEGRPLSALIEEGPLRLDRALEIAHQIALALDSAHGRGIIHRDMKPDNVLLVERDGGKDFVKVLDFGIAKVQTSASVADRPITQVGLVYGTPEYMAPEQALGQEVDARADIYALGVMLYELLAGVRPYGGPVTGLLGQQLSQPIPLIKDRSGVVVPPGVEAFVRQMLMTDVNSRVGTAREVVEKLRILLEATSGDPARRRMLSSHLDDPRIMAQTAAGVPTPRAPARRASDRRGKGRGILLTLALAGLGGGGAFFGLTYLEKHSPEKTTVAPPAPPPELLPPNNEPTNLIQDIEVARATGIDALVALSKKFPAEGTIFAVLSVELAKTEKYDEAVDAARHALELDPRLNENKSIRGALYRAAQSGKATSAAFRLLEGPMGSEGADIIYDISIGDGVKPRVRTQANQFLQGDAVRAVASPGLLLLIDLTRAEAQTCEAVLAVVERAALQGDQRAIPRLQALESKVGCGPSKKEDCYPCLRQGGLLAFAIATIEKRAVLPESGETQPGTPAGP
jgi:tRNA A-37 threonylcarbamoyl transferase component Bud32